MLVLRLQIFIFRNEVCMDIFTGSIDERRNKIKKLLNMDVTFDIIQRNITVGGKEIALFSINGFLNSDLCEKLIEYFYTINQENMPQDVQGFMHKCMPFADIKPVSNEKDFKDALLAGLACFVIDGYKEILSVDIRRFPSRSIEEPDKDKVLRGARDGFVESLIPNTALIRRRIRDENLIFEIQKAGRSSRTDLAVAYMKGRVNRDVIIKVLNRIKSIDADSLTMNQESLAEAIFPGHWYNPFPKFKYTERPDAAAACLLEGSVVILVDNSPSAMIIPTSLFDIIEDANDYYFPPITGTYLRFTRMLTNILALFITPVFLMVIENPGWIPKEFEFIMIKDDIHVNPLLQFLILELAVDGLKMASVNTPSMLSTPLSVVAAIVFGDYTVQSGWFNSEIMLYMAFVAVANYTQSNMELGYALKFSRIFLLIVTEFAGVWGFAAGTVVIVFALLFNKTFTGRGYLYPLLPFNGIQLLKRFFRVSLRTNEKFQQKANR